jgi:hypothetical protein
VLKGPFVFDAITGEADPIFDTLKLPVAEYRGIKLIIGCESGADTSLCKPITISGTFDCQDTARTFSFKILFSTMLLYKYIGPPTLIDPNDTTLFEVTLNANGWLSGIDFAARLADSTIALDSLGNLALDAATATNGQKAIAGAIRDNIAESFKNAKLQIHSNR